MRKIGKESTSPAESGDSRGSSDKGWLRNHWCSVSLAVIVVLTLLLRTVFTYGTSAGGDFALSGGSSSQYHLHVIESILSGSYAIGADAAVNYPLGGLNVYPPLLDFIAAGVASVLSMTGLGSTEAASAALGGLNPVIGALACIPVYLVAKEMFDKRAGVVAALVYAFLALPIATSVFSSGTEYALAAFLAAFMSYFLVKTAKALDSADTSKAAMKYGLLTGVFLGLAALTWNGFGVLIAVIAATMLLQAVSDRFRGADMKVAIVPYALAIIVGTVLAAVYYIPAGLFDAVFSGPLLLAVFSVAFAFVFMALRSKPWIIVIPALVIVFVVVLVALYFAVPDLFNALVNGNSIYVEGMADLVSDRVSMSNVSSYYGWVTMWLPICLALYETYVYLKKDRTASRLMIAVWLYMMFFAVWSSYQNAAVVAAVFGVGSGAAIVMVLQQANLRDWARNIRSAGFPGGIRKMIKPLPLASVLVAVLLIAVPGVSFALDAGTPANDSDSPLYNGNTQFVIKTGDSYPVDAIWGSVENPDSALVNWIDYTYDAVSQGGFDTVTDIRGDGTSAMAHILLSEGSTGAVAAMAMRIIMSNNVDDFASCFASADLFGKIKGFVNDPCSAKDEIVANPDVYGSVASDLSDINAVNLVCIELLSKELGTVGVYGLYDSVCAVAGEKIGYILVDPMMLPLQSGASSNFSSMASMGGYNIDSNGAAPEFFTYMNYFGYTVYTDAMYDTFLWKAMIGPSATEAGESSSYSYLFSLSASDGSEDSVVVTPEGMAGFEIAKWIIQYNPDRTATGSSDGWEYMDYDAAMALQKSQGGVVNYLSSYMLYKYVGLGTGTESGNVSVSSGAVDGMTVEVLQYNEHLGKYTVYSVGTVKDGAYAVAVPDTGDYKVAVKSGSVVLASYDKGAVPANIAVSTVSVSGNLLVGEAVYNGPALKVVMTNKATGEENVVENVVDSYSVSGILPGEYDVAIYNGSGTSMASVSVAIAADSTTFGIGLTVKTITATVKDANGDLVADGTTTVRATNVDTGESYSAETVEGVAAIPVVPGTYTVSLEGKYVSMMSTTQNASSSNKSVSITGYDSQVVSGIAPGLSVYAGEFSTTSDANGVALPVGKATDKTLYSVYGIVDGKVVLGTVKDGVASTASYDMATVTGKLDRSGTVSFIIDGATVSVVTDSDGKFTAYLPAGKDCIVYATDKATKVYFGSIAGIADSDMGDITMVDGRKVSTTLKYASGTSTGSVALPFVKAGVVFTYDNVEYTLNGMTNVSGQAVFYAPDNVEVKALFNDGALDNTMFACTDLSKTVSSGTSNATNTVTIAQYDSGANVTNTNYVRQVTVTSAYKVELDPYVAGDNIVLEKDVPTLINPGQFTAKVTEGGYYFDGTVNILPGSSEIVGLEPMEAVKIDVTTGSGNVVTVTSEGEYAKVGQSYYLQKGFDFLFKSVGGTGADKLVKYVQYTDGSATTSLDLTADTRVMTITGFIGVAAEGTLTATAGGIAITADVEKGQFSIELPETMTSARFSVEASLTEGDMEYDYAGEIDVTGLADGEFRNVPVYGAGVPVVDEDATFTVGVVSSDFSNGNGTVVIEIRNETPVVRQYTIAAGSAWLLKEAYSVSVAAGSAQNVTVTGIYDVDNVAVGNAGLTLEVTDVAAQKTESVAIVDNGATPVYGTLDILKAGDDGATIDRISAGEYMYAVTIVNNGVSAQTVTITAANVAGWNLALVDEAGLVISDMTGGASFEAYGLQTTVVYVKLMLLQTAANNNAPAISVAVAYENGNASLDMSPVTVDVTLDSMEASGSDVFNERSDVPIGIWFMLAVGILMLVAVFWLGSKRGVFSRRK
ncbi:MAG: glycosyltransferase family 39 protein [Candidatus Methanomethylophilaceae archaeon]|nr:glycosyltransferase family 39 protein [Candidatus Methanomethylophilaceae archaeon]